MTPLKEATSWLAACPEEQGRFDSARQLQLSPKFHSDPLAPQSHNTLAQLGGDFTADTFSRLRQQHLDDEFLARN